MYKGLGMNKSAGQFYCVPVWESTGSNECVCQNIHDQKHPLEVFCKKGVLKNSRENTCVEVFFLITPATLLKKRLWHRYSSVNFAKFLRTNNLWNTSKRLLLQGYLYRIVFITSFDTERWNVHKYVPRYLMEN